ncbi:MAG: SDR family oxidoreductase [Oscillospiraceae bacterium]|jgi:NAD(P)-dependent dehydrogenase (short-subunit alcohol dehydrogenase family)|nr:SDR family oxidoreductase [Oscillospiraceae bacterium]
MRKAAFVTGAGKVTGKAIALCLGKEYDVGISYVNSEQGALDTVRQIEGMGGRARAYRCDARDLEATKRVMDAFASDFGRFDVLVNNAGITKFYDFLDVTEAQYDDVMDTDLKGTYFTGQFAARKMADFGQGGVIINISSVHATGTWPGDTVYATAKAAVCRLTQAMALDLAKHKIRVLCVAPGYIDTGWQNNREDGRARMESIVSRIPLRRFATGEEIGGICAFLASDKASYITGSTLYAEGGALLPVITENDYM